MSVGYFDKQGYLLAESEREIRGELVTVAVKDDKGMSVSLSIDGLPNFRKPAKFGGIAKDPLWQIDDNCSTGDLEAIQDSATHVSILPKTTMSLARYEAALANTQNYWERVD